jgi:fructosamine-3-kinase
MAIGYLLVGKLVMPTTWESFYVENRSNWVRMLSTYKNIVDVKTIDITEDMVPELLSKSKMIDYV